MTPLEHAKAVVERSRVAKLSARATAAIGEVRTIVSGAEAEAIGRLAVWAECEIALDRYAVDGAFTWSQLLTVLESHGFDDDTGGDAGDFVKGLRDAVITKGDHNAK